MFSWIRRLFRKLTCDHRKMMVPVRRTAYILTIQCRHCGVTSRVDVDQWTRDWEEYKDPTVPTLIL